MLTELKQARLELGLTQTQLANKVGISVRAYQFIEHEYKQPRVLTALKIANVLNRTVEELFGYMLDNYLLLGSSDTPNK